MLKSYLKEIYDIARRGDAREESYYPTLKDFLEVFSESIDKNDVRVTVLPKKTDAGNPDFRVWEGSHRIIGYIEAKPPEANLDIIEKTNQILRYKSTFKNFILTNFFEFRFYRNGDLIEIIKIANPAVIQELRKTIYVENEEDCLSLFNKFYSFSFPSITKAETLAKELAMRTKFLRDEIIDEIIEEEKKNGINNILGFYEAFKTYLIKGLKEEEFVELYSQTITYGLFTSRMRCSGEFSRKTAKVRSLVFDPEVSGKIYYTSLEGFLISDDDGESWRKVDILTEVEKKGTTMVAISNDSSNIYLGIDSAIYKSSDDGQSWEVNRITTGLIHVIICNPQDNQKVYAGIAKLPTN